MAHWLIIGTYSPVSKKHFPTQQTQQCWGAARGVGTCSVLAVATLQKIAVANKAVATFKQQYLLSSSNLQAVATSKKYHLFCRPR